jgi:hypothetical protein
MKWRILVKTTPFHALKKTRSKWCHFERHHKFSSSLDAQRIGEEEAIMFPCNATISLSLCPHLPKNTQHNPYPHSLNIMMKKGEGMPYPVVAGVLCISHPTTP